MSSAATIDLFSVSQASSSDARARGQHVANQRTKICLLMQLRTTFQTCISEVNRLPYDRKLIKQFRRTDSEINNLYAGLEKALVELDKHLAVFKDPTFTRKTKRGSALRTPSARASEILRKAHAQSHTLFSREGRTLHVVGQDVCGQIDHVLADTPRMRRRTSYNRLGVVPVGHAWRGWRFEAASAGPKLLGDAARETRIVRPPPPRYLAHIFDDTDFLAAITRWLSGPYAAVELSFADAGAGALELFGARARQLRAQQHRYHKKYVRGGSKHRRILTNTHEPIVAFTEPAPYPQEDAPMVAGLFSRLFGGAE